MGVQTLLPPQLRMLVRDIVVGNYLLLEADRRAGRSTTAELQQAVKQYGRTLINPPTTAFERVEMSSMRDSTFSWSIIFDLWTLEEGIIDLSISLTANLLSDETLVLQIDDLHVL